VPSEPTPQLNAALAKVQKELPKIPKTQTGKVSGISKDTGKPFSYEYKYADLEDVSAAIEPLLGKNGLAFTSGADTDGQDRMVLDYALLHESGEERIGQFPLWMLIPQRVTAQQLGGLLTYARRYTLCSVTGVAPGGEDNDAVGAGEVNMDRVRTAWSDPEHQRLAQPSPDERVNGTGAQRFRGPARPDEWANPEDRPGSVTDAQMRKLQATLSKLFTKDERDQRLAAAEQIIGRQLTGPKDGRTSSNLSLTEASKLIDTLDGLTREQLVARMAEAAS
jgi:hypothetical protein